MANGRGGVWTIHCSSKLFFGKEGCIYAHSLQQPRIIITNTYLHSIVYQLFFYRVLPMIVMVLVMVIYSICMNVSGIQESLQGAPCSKRRTLNKGSQKSAKPLLSSTHMLSAIPPCTIKVAPMNFKWLVILLPCKFAMKTY